MNHDLYFELFILQCKSLGLTASCLYLINLPVKPFLSSGKDSQFWRVEKALKHRISENVVKN